jgi:hypothetical protein
MSSGLSRHRTLGYCLGMIGPEKRFALFRVMLRLVMPHREDGR